MFETKVKQYKKVKKWELKIPTILRPGEDNTE